MPVLHPIVSNDESIDKIIFDLTSMTRKNTHDKDSTTSSLGVMMLKIRHLSVPARPPNYSVKSLEKSWVLLLPIIKI